MTEAKPEPQITVGMVLIGKYRVIREIGRGGMAAVYEALHLSLGKKVALKVLAADLAASRTVIERFFREARAAASVKSPYIVDIYDSGRLEDDRPFIAMELLEGETLYDLMTRVRLIDTRTTLRMVTQCAKGLMRAHAVGIVHRDLKPENIFLLTGDDGEPTLKLLDFGLAKFYAPMNPDAKTARLTREGAVFGTPAYMSPEQVKGQGTVDHRADLWALGCITFECLTGRPVWNIEQGVAMTFAAIAASPLPVPTALRPGLPPGFDPWFRRALERDPDRRFQSARDLADALARAFGEPSGVASRSGELDISGLLEATGSSGTDLFGPPSGPLPPPSNPRPEDSGRLPPPALDSAKTIAQEDVPPSGFQPHGREVPGWSPQLAAPRPAGRGVVRYAVSTAALLASTSGAFLTWDHVLRPQVWTPLVQSTATYAEPSPSTGAGQVLPQDTPRWETTIEEGQQLFAVGDFAAAQEKFRRAQEQGAPPGVARAFADETKAGLAGMGDCKMAAFSRPRMAVGGNAQHPSVASSTKRTVLSWSDDHEQSGHQHVYAVVIDPAGRPMGHPRDLTPEAVDVGRPSLITVGDRMALVYADKTGPQVGVRVRWVDEDARLAGDSKLVGGVRPGQYWPALQRAPDGLFVAWEDDRAQDASDLFLRHVGRDLEPVGSEIRVTDYEALSGRRPAVRSPALTVASSSLYLVYKLEREGQPHSIVRMRVPLDSAALATGLDFGTAVPSRVDRTLGDVLTLSEAGVASESPVISCGTEGCFVAWHGERGGTWAALIDPVQGRLLWRRRFADRGGPPALAVGDSGAVAVAFYDAGAVRIAMMTRDGVAAPSTFARVTGEAPRPWVAPGRARGEWFVAWQDSEAGHGEVYAARVVCQ